MWKYALCPSIIDSLNPTLHPQPFCPLLFLLFYSSPSLQNTPLLFIFPSLYFSLSTSVHCSFCFLLSSASLVPLMHSHQPFIHVDVLFIKASIIQPTPRHLRSLRSTSHSIIPPLPPPPPPQHMVCPWRPVHSQLLCSSPPSYWVLGGLTCTRVLVCFFGPFLFENSRYRECRNCISTHLGFWWSCKKVGLEMRTMCRNQRGHYRSQWNISVSVKHLTRFGNNHLRLILLSRTNSLTPLAEVFSSNRIIIINSDFFKGLRLRTILKTGYFSWKAMVSMLVHLS